MSRSRDSWHLRLALCSMAFLSGAHAQAGAPSLIFARAEPSGSDVFVMVREAILRDRPSRESRMTGRLPGGSRLKLIDARGTYLKVEVVAGDRPAGDGKKSAAPGFVSRDVVSIFPPDPAGLTDLIVAGRVLSATEPHRRYGAAFLLRASERVRSAGGTDAAVELLLGETAEALALAGGPFPPGLDVTRAPGEGPWRYSGEAFRRAFASAEKLPPESGAGLKERATAGLLRQRYVSNSPDSPSLPLLWQETADWLALAEAAHEPAAARCAADRLGTASLSLGRLLLAAGRLEDLEKLEVRVRQAGGRTAALELELHRGGEPSRQGQLPADLSARRLISRASILRSMRGDGTSPLRQEARAKIGPKEVVVRIGGALGKLELSTETTVGGTHIPAVRKLAIPVLPVPGSLRISPDGRSVAWLEVVSPSKLVPVVTSLDRDEPAREIAFLSEGRPLRDNALGHVISTLSGYSKDGQRLGVAIQAWNDTPGPEARYSVVSVATGEIVFETSKDTKAFQRLIQ
ncbi:MAG: hypothetical protein ABI682_09465 [Acidobacteriota bacterium]